MKITLIAPGSRGDVQPYLALGSGLQRAGHTVKVLTHQNFAALVAAAGLEFHPAESDVRGIVESERMRDRIENGNFLLLLSQMAKEAEREALQFARAGLEACRGADLLLAGMGGLFIAIALAEKLDLPLVQAYVVPFTPTAAFPSVLAPSLPLPPGKAVNRLTHTLTRQLMWQGFRQADRLAREEVLGLGPTPAAGPYRSACMRDMPVLYGFSPAVIPAPPDWDSQVHVTGYWFLDRVDWTPPESLTAFLETGPAPVYIGFGSMSNRDPGRTTALILEALRQTGQRAVLLSGWGGLRQSDLPDTVCMLDSVPHDWLFPRMAAVVHHGGASTTAAGLRAGVPSLIVPFFGDQPYWGRKVAELGVGPQAIPRRQLSAARLARELVRAVEDRQLRANADALGKRIRAEAGSAAAAEVIGQLSRPG
jgi:UDP:flavonoid glycosyltransferase YjiC (YdhE family)